MTRHGVFLLTAEANIVRCVPEQSLTMGHQHAENSDRTENRESEIPISCMKLVLDQHSAGIGRRAILRTHATNNDARQQRQETSRWVQRANTQRVAMSWAASYMDAKILMFQGIGSVGDSTHILTIFEDTRHIVTTHWPISPTCAEQVRCTSTVRKWATQVSRI